MISFQQLKEDRYYSFHRSSECGRFSFQFFLETDSFNSFHYVWDYSDFEDKVSELLNNYSSVKGNTDYINIAIIENLNNGAINIYQLVIAILFLGNGDNEIESINISSPKNSILSCSEFIEMMNLYQRGMQFKNDVETQNDEFNVLVEFDEFLEVKSWELKTDKYIFHFLLSDTDIRNCYYGLINRNDYTNYVQCLITEYQSKNNINYITILVADDSNRIRLFDMSISITKLNITPNDN